MANTLKGPGEGTEMRHIWIPHPDWTELGRHAEARGMTRSAYVRHAIKRYHQKQPELLKQISPRLPAERQEGEHGLAECLAVVHKALLEHRLDARAVLLPEQYFALRQEVDAIKKTKK